MKKRLTSDPIDVELPFAVGDRVTIRFRSSVYNHPATGTVIGIEVEYALSWKRMLDVKGEVKDSTNVIYTVLTDDGDMIKQSEWTIYLSELKED
jgi:small-conductance mechanosensitive channel